MARDTRVAGEIESNQGTLGIQRSRFEKYRLCCLDILGAPDCIGEVDPRGGISGICVHKTARDRGGQVPFLGR
jgi:hypothetical protein